jgi:Icc-related predicted phosphoesterase
MHVCGHIHEGYGLDYNLDTTFVNASICNQYYNPTNEPWVFDIVGKEVTAI